MARPRRRNINLFNLFLNQKWVNMPNIWSASIKNSLVISFACYVSHVNVVIPLMRWPLYEHINDSTWSAVILYGMYCLYNATRPHATSVTMVFCFSTCTYKLIRNSFWISTVVMLDTSSSVISSFFRLAHKFYSSVSPSLPQFLRNTRNNTDFWEFNSFQIPKKLI